MNLDIGSMLKNLYYKTKNLIVRAYIDKIIPDDNYYPIVSVSYLNKKNVFAERINPYGLYTNPPQNLQALKFSVFGKENNAVAIVYSQDSRFKGLEEGEVTIGNEKTQTYIKLSENGDIEIKTDAVIKLLATDVETTGDLNLTVNGDVNVDASQVNLGVGGNDIARRGDAVQVNIGTGLGTITGGGVNTSI